METQARAAKPLHPLVWIAGIALILFSAAGVGAFMGWIPTSMGKPGEPGLVKLEQPVASAARPAAASPRPAPAKAPVPAAGTVPPPAAAAKCADCGVIESVREIDTKGEGSGLGAVGGAVVGGVLGSQVGGGSGKKVMTVVGAVGGAVAGNEIEKQVKSTKSYSIAVRFDDGTSRVFTEANAPTWRAGDKVRVVNGLIQSNG